MTRHVSVATVRTCVTPCTHASLNPLFDPSCTCTRGAVSEGSPTDEEYAGNVATQVVASQVSAILSAVPLTVNGDVSTYSTLLVIVWCWLELFWVGSTAVYLSTRAFAHVLTICPEYVHTPDPTVQEAPADTAAVFEYGDVASSQPVFVATVVSIVWIPE